MRLSCSGTIWYLSKHERCLLYSLLACLLAVVLVHSLPKTATTTTTTRGSPLFWLAGRVPLCLLMLMVDQTKDGSTSNKQNKIGISKESHNLKIQKVVYDSSCNVQHVLQYQYRFDHRNER